MIKICKQCGNDFEAATAWRRLCDECRELNEKEHNRSRDERWRDPEKVKAYRASEAYKESQKRSREKTKHKYHTDEVYRQGCLGRKAKYREKNHDKVLAAKRLYNATHKEQIAEYNKRRREQWILEHKDEIEAKRQAREEARQRRQAEKETPKPRPRRNPEYKNFRKAIDRDARAKRFGFVGIKRRFSTIEITKCLHGFNCAVCHFEKSAKFNEVHHITPIKDFQSVQEANNLNNLICLCPTCHKKADMGLIPKETLRKLADDAQYELSDHVIDAMNSGRDVPKEWAPVLYEYARELKEYS